MDRITVAQSRKADSVGRKVILQGWVRTRRDSKGGFSFIELNDGSSQGNVQIIAGSNLPNYEVDVKKLPTGASISVEGEVKASPAKGQATEVHASQIIVHGLADPEKYPLQKKGHSFEFLRTIAHLRPRTNTFGAIARIRNCVCRSFHNFFQEQGFLYIHTPIITGSDCEGAGALFRVTTLDPAKVPLTPQSEGRQSPELSAAQGAHAPRSGEGVDFTKDFFHRPTYLTVSGQLQVEAFACSMGKVYTFGPTFRAENSNTPRHLAEFWMIEPEMAFYDLHDNMALAEAFLKRIVKDVLADCAEDMRFIEERIDKEVLTRLRTILDKEFLRVSYTEAIDIILKAGQTWEFPVAWGTDLQAEHEKYLTEKHFQGPIVLYDYP